MKRYKITLLVEHSKEVIVASAQEAHNEATRLAGTKGDGTPKAIVQSIELLGDVETTPLNFDIE